MIVIRRRGLVLAVAAALVLGAALVLLGRATVDRDAGAATARHDGYFDGLLAGEAQGRLEGRAAQEVDGLPAGTAAAVRRAFADGYAAGANDAFAGYDGGWALGAPYVVTVVAGKGAVVYRIATREPVKPGVAYYLCPSGHGLCSQPRK
jgi:hypothetical protein